MLGSWTMRSVFSALVIAALSPFVSVSALTTEEANQALLAGAREGRLEFVDRALRAGASANAREDSGEQFTALIHAVRGGHGPVVRLLLERGADPNRATISGFTPLMFAAYYDRAAVATQLLDKGADITSHNQLDGNTALHVAARRGSVETLVLLLERGADPNDASNADGSPPLLLAAREAYGLKSVLELLAHGADVNQAGADGSTALMGASIRGYAHISEVLILNKADVNAVSSDGRSALHRAATTGRIAIIEQLLKAGARVDQRAGDGDTPLGAAVYFGQSNAVARLIEAGARPDRPARDGETPLMRAVRGNHPEIAVLLLRKGADVNARVDGVGTTALILAAERGLSPFVGSLLKAGADVHHRTADGLSALKAAKSIDSAPTIALLRDAGAVY